MSKWGIEEKETLETINKIGFKGNILDVASGDGRFINSLLELSDKVIAIDIDKNELESIKNISNKLYTEVVDITKRFPYEDNSFDGVFCTGTLHLFNKETLTFILKEINRCLKHGGKIVLDFATDIERLDNNGNKVVFENEGNYNTNEAIELFKEELNNFSLDIQVSTFKEENLENIEYKSIRGNFLIISGIKQ